MASITPYRFIDALAPPEFTISGVVLKSFSLGHWMILEQIGSPFLSDKESNETDLEGGFQHFFMFLLICAQTYEDNVKMLSNPDFFKDTVKVYEENVKKALKADKGWNIYSQIQHIKAYISYFVKMPVFEEKHERKSMPSGIDWRLNLFAIMRNEYGYSESEILNMPVRRLFYEWCAFAEKNDAIKVQNAFELETMRQLGHKV